jgi:hypothetical protein
MRSNRQPIEDLARQSRSSDSSKAGLELHLKVYFSRTCREDMSVRNWESAVLSDR